MKARRSLKKKFTVSIATLIILSLLSVGAALIFREKQQIETQIYLQTRAFADLTAPKIVESAQSFLLQENQIPFERDIKEYLNQSPDIESIELYRFDQSLLYQSTDQVTSTDKERIQSSLPSIETTTGHVFYLKKEDAGRFSLVDANLSPVPQESVPQHIVIRNLYSPQNQEFTVVYNISYQNLQSRLIQQALTLAAIIGIALLASILISLLLASAVTKPILKLNSAVKNIAKGNFEHRVSIKSKDEVGELAKSVNQMAEDLVQATEAKIYKSRVEKELELAKKIQENLLPKSIPTIKGLEIAGSVMPATEIGGDVYDVLEGENGELLTYVGDVTGHGVPAGILASISNSIIMSKQDADLTSMANTLNIILKTKATPNMFITAALARYNPEKPNNLDYLSAGHEQLIHFKASTKKAKMLPSGGIALGMFPDVSKLLKEQKVEDFETGDTIILYSDGIPEAWKNEEETYGFDRLVENLEKNASSNTTAQSIHDAILKDIQDFTNGYEQKDDITLLVLRRMV